MSGTKSINRKWIRRLAIALCASLAAGFTQICWPLEVNISTAGPYDEIVDRGLVTITAEVAGYPPSAPVGLVLDCNAIATSFVGSAIHFELKLKTGDQPQAPCFGKATLTVGPLSVGTYSVTAHLVDDTGRTAADAQTAFNVSPVAGRCNAHPQITPQIIAVPATGTLAQFQQRVLTDAAYAALLGNPIVEVQTDFVLLGYPSLINPSELRANLEDSGQFSRVEENSPVCFSSAPVGTGIATEFFNATLQHYFYTGDPYEKAVLDSGTIAGWSETGEMFPVTTRPSCIPSIPTGNPAVVYRFYGLPVVGTGTHFLTISRNECYVVNRWEQWIYEGVAFWAAVVASDGSCSTGLQPLYRAWRPFGDSEHRYSTKPTVIDQMVAQGWVSEGPVMCVPQN